VAEKLRQASVPKLRLLTLKVGGELQVTVALWQRLRELLLAEYLRE